MAGIAARSLPVATGTSRPNTSDALGFVGTVHSGFTEKPNYGRCNPLPSTLPDAAYAPPIRRTFDLHQSAGGIISPMLVLVVAGFSF
jgi:hypothetical protein